MGVQHFHGQGLHPLYCTGSRASLGRVATSCLPNRPNNCVNFMVPPYFTNVADDHIIQHGKPWDGDPCAVGLGRESASHFWRRGMVLFVPNCVEMPPAVFDYIC